MNGVHQLDDDEAAARSIPTSFSAAEALAVKMTVYSGGARKNVKTADRAWSAWKLDNAELIIDIRAQPRAAV
jgi:hypothetical protein